MTKHAVFANLLSSDGEALTVRVGQPTGWGLAQARWERLDNRRGGFAGVPRRRVKVRMGRRVYTVLSFEVRSVDGHGRGIGSERHGTAIPVPYRNVRSALAR